ncbi:MAG: hypothetical protein CMJ19_19020 [Phycisphaeraceae bacterium]|nr:hypothetical protein [Phycisphaeraceae bacterium]
MMVKTAILLACVLGITAISANASPIVDGRFDVGEGYNYAISVAPSSYNVDKNPGDPATMYFFQDPSTFNLSVFVSLPATYVDNSYGVNAVGWTNKGHSFKDLLNSDKADFTVSIHNQTVLQFGIDYLYQPKHSDDWFAGVDGNDGFASDANAILGAATSMQYNLGLAGADQYLDDSPNASSDSYDNSALADWIFEATYEFEIDGDVLGNQFVLGDGEWLNGFELYLDDLHASPNKRSEFAGITPPPPSAVPEPSSAALLGLAAMGLLTRRRRGSRR